MLKEVREIITKMLYAAIIMTSLIFFSSCSTLGQPETVSQKATETEPENTAASSDITAEGEPNRIEIVLKLDLLELKDFSEGKAAARNSEGLWGFVDMQGNWIIEPEYDGVGDFSEGRAKVGFASEDAINSQSEEAQLIADASGEENIAIENNRIILDKWGYINEKGDVIVEPQYKYANDFSNGLAYVGDNSGPYYIDYDGNVALNPDDFEGYQFDGDFEQDGTAVIYGMTENGAERTHYSGVIDKQGNLLIDGYQLNISNISKAVGSYRIAESNNKSAGGDTGVIDAQRKWVIEPIYDEIEFFDEGTLVATQVTEGILESGLMTLEGRWLAEPDGTKIQDFGYDMMVHYSMREPQKMELYDYDGNILLRGKSWQTIAIAGDGLVLCKKDDHTPDALFWSDGTQVMEGLNAVGGRYLAENLISVTVKKDDKEIIGILDKINPNEWLAEPKYDKILELGDNTYAGTIVLDQNNDMVSFYYETFNTSGEIISTSREITLAYDTYRKFISFE